VSVLGWDEYAGASSLSEVDWLQAADPLLLLAYLRRRTDVCHAKEGKRKLRLFTCACARRHWMRLEELPPSVCAVLRSGVEYAERFADGLIDKAEFDDTVATSRRLTWQWGASAFSASFTARQATHSRAFEPAWEVARSEPRVAGRVGTPGFLGEQQAKCELLREIFGNPFRVVRVDPAWLRGNDGAVVMLARSIWEEQAFEQMPILADALEDAGCADDDVLAHCRQTSSHVRGCWVVELLRGLQCLSVQ
jgi:hypothetical protein